MKEASCSSQCERSPVLGQRRVAPFMEYHRCPLTRVSLKRECERDIVSLLVLFARSAAEDPELWAEQLKRDIVLQSPAHPSS